jgi:hypothetical protein
MLMLLAMLQLSADPFFAIELYAFRIALLILFFLGLYRLLKYEIKR